MGKTLEKFYEKYTTIVQTLVAYMLFAMILLVFYQILARGFLHWTTAWAEESCKLLLVYITFLGSTGVLVKGENLTIDILLVRYNERQKNIAMIFANLIVFALAVYLVIFGYQLCTHRITLMSKTEAMELPKIIEYIAVPVSMAFNAVYAVFAIGKYSRLAFGKKNSLSLDKLKK